MELSLTKDELKNYHGFRKEESMELLDKSSYIPYYVQIKHILLDRIQHGIYKENVLIPSETELSKEFSVTRMTIRKALDELRREGMIRTERGKGSVVSPAKIEQSLKRFYLFGKEIGDTGIPAKSQVIRTRTCSSPSEAVRYFEESFGKEFYEVVRLRFFKDSPVSLEFSYIPCAMAPGLLDEPIETISLAELLEKKYGKTIEKATEHLYPRISDVYESRLLGIQTHSPVFQTERITKADDGNIIEFRRSVIRGDKISFSTELT